MTLYKWKPDYLYAINSIVYPSEDNGLYYIATKTGKTCSNTEAYSSIQEPEWGDKTIIDGNLVWRRIPCKDTTNIYSVNTLYHLGDKIIPTTGTIEVLGDYYGYILHEINAEPDWPTIVNETVVDNEIIWEACISTYQFVPKELRKDKIYVEFCTLLDYLLQNPNLSLKNILNKYKDRSKLDATFLQDFIAEQGYNYIINVLNLTQKELHILTEYLNLVHLLKGTKEGLQLVFNLLGIIYTIEEWWEKEPKGEPHTFSLEIEFDLSSVKRESINRISEFVSHYVFPKMEDIVVNYNAQLAEMYVTGVGVFDTTLQGEDAYNAFVDINIFAHIETTIAGITIIPDILNVQLLSNEVFVLPTNKVLLFI